MSFSRYASRPLRCAFTLVELLVVIGIIALLISILLPSLSAAREQGNRTKCLSNLRQIAMAVLSYSNEHKGFLPKSATTGTGNPMDGIFWQPARDLDDSALAPHFGKPVNRATLICPTDDVTSRKYTGNGGYRFSYTMNLRMSLIKFNKIINPTDKVVFYEEDENTMDDCNASLDQNLSIDLLAIRHERIRSQPDNETTGISANGNKRGNASFADGHVEYIDRNRLHTASHYDPAKRF